MPILSNAYEARAGTPINNGAETTGRSRGPWDLTGSDNLNSDALRDIDHADKLLSTTRAQLALAGWTLHELTDCVGGTAFVAGRLATSRILPNRHALAQFARLVGVGAR
jgi:hypothetical protein